MKMNLLKKVLSIFLCIALFMTNLPLSVMAASYEYKGGAGTKISDFDTSLKYSESLGDNASTEYAGRIWTDKSVYTGDKTFDVFGGGTSTIKLNENNNGEDFLIAYSALATTESISGSTQAPVDVVLIIDISGSMSNNESNMDNNKSRIYNTVQATNNAIDELMKLNPYTRVAVVAFSSNAQVLLPLDRYTKTTDWVEIEQPGPNTWEQQEIPYFTLSRDTGSNNYATLYTKAINSSNSTVNKSTSVEGGTNIQIGLYEGMQVLAEEDETTANINGETVQRVPSVILLSDGSPTYSSNSSSWWAPSDNYNDGPGSAPYAGNGMKAILVGSYMKDAIDRNYKVANTSFATTVYTIGMGITGLSDTEKNLAYMTLDPGTYWNDNNVVNTMKTSIVNYWDSYTSNSNTGTLNINVGKYQNRRYSDEYYTLTHPNTGYDVDPTNGYDYVDDYYDADNASAVTSVFNEIVANIAISAPQVPTEIKGIDPMTDGYITYTDPIGDYMEVKDVKAIIYAGQTFTAKSTATSGNTTTYTFAGEVHSPVYGDQEIKNIIITVTETAGKQTLVVKIPASVIPLRINEVMLNADGTVKTHTNNGAMPTRVIYSVGLQSEITKEANDGTVYIDKSKLSANYLSANTNDDGTINFYSNEYTNPHTINNHTVGDTTVEFEPSHTNKFYYILEDMPIYKDKQFNEQVESTGDLNIDLPDDSKFYYRDEHYHGNSVEITAVERTGEQLKKTNIKIGTDGKLYRATDSPRLNKILEFEGTKIANATDTAQDFYAPEFHHASGSTSAYDGKFIVHLGNNGILSMTAGGDLQISKIVNAGIGLTAPDKTFEFNIDLTGSEVNNSTYNYVIVDAEGNEVGTGTISASNKRISLKNGQVATIHSLPPETTYMVTETAVSGFTVQSEGATGTIAASQTSYANFTNTYNVEPEVWPTNNELKGTKELLGREWNANDYFTFFISPYNDAPLPDGYNADAGISVNKPDTVGGQTATFDFGTIKFTAPGIYRYTIAEKEPGTNETIPGISYSRALYRVVITVVDNGDGTLSVTDSNIQKLYDDSANQLFTYQNGQIVMNNGEEAQDTIKFTNKYSVDAVTRVPVAIKEYTDNSGQKPLVSGMFEFELKALGIVENGQIVDTDISKVPMPNGSQNGTIITTNEGHNITFPSVTFTQNDIPVSADSITFRYQMREVIPTNAVNGMDYDDSVYTVDVVVSVDTVNHTLNVVTTASNQERIVSFKNEYTPKSITADIDGSKTLIGRDMKSGESFEFVLGSNAETGNAIRDGIVIVPSSTETVTGGKNGIAESFAFKNIEFKKAGTYVFTVSETAGSASSIEYDDSVITVTIVIDDTNNDGNLELVSKTYSNERNAAEFTNTYTSTFNGSPVNLRGTKNLTGKTLLAGEFYFDIKEFFNGVEADDRYVTHTADDTADNGVYNGTIVFLDDVTYDKAGTYEYVITEQIPNNKVVGTTYDESKFRFTVIVEDDLNGNLIVTSTKLEKANGSGWGTAEAVVYNNTYVPNPTTATLPLINKIIDGDRSESLKAGEFEFKMNVASADPADGISLPSNNIVSNAANGNITFDEITFTKAGIYVVSIQEIEPDEANKVAGITYSKQKITAVYSVHDDRNGKLTATLTQLIGGENIINTYAADPAEVTIDITKNFTGRANDSWLTTDKFDFNVKVVDANTLSAIEKGDIEFTFNSTSTDTATYTISSKGDKASTAIKVNKPGTYKFVVSEVDGSIEGVKYDKSEKEIVIVATDDSVNAKIKVEINGYATNKATVEFTNTYVIDDEDEIILHGTKKLTGDRTQVKANEFEFGIYDAENKLIESVKNDANGNFKFAALKFDENDVAVSGQKQITYTVKEIAGDNTRYTYDDTIYTVVVTVKDNEQGGITTTYTVNSTPSDNAEITFTNGYTNPTPITYTPMAKKNYNKTLNGGEFKFKLEGNINGTPVSQEKTNAADGLITFDTLNFPEAGTYTFTVKEIDKVLNYINYSAAEYQLVVNIIDTKGVLSLGSVTVNNDPNGTIEFINTYVIDDEDEITLRGTKKLTGSRTQVYANEFEFGLYDAEGKLIESVKNDADGNFKFTTLKFDENDVAVSGQKQITYTVKEIKGSDIRVTYDETIYTVVVTVKDNEKGGITSSYTVNDVTDGLIEFTNIYTQKPEDVTINFDINKTVVNKGSEKIGPEGFEFLLNALADGVSDITVKTDEKGKAKFTLTFTESDIGNTYTYKLTEVNGAKANVTYSDAEYTISVAIALNENNELVATLTKNGENVTSVVTDFENIYDYTPAPAPNPKSEYPSSPHTGDNTNLNIWFALLLISGGGLIGTTLYGRKRKAEEN